MPIKILTAPPATGKTTCCIDRVLEVRQAYPNTDIWVLVPDGYQANAFRRQIAARGGGLGVYEVTFNNLLREILEASGNSVPLTPPALERAFIKNAVEKVYDRGDLQHFSAIRDTPGFISALQQRFAELKRGMVYPEDFLEYAPKQSESIRELAAVYAAYQTLLVLDNWADSEGLSWLAIEFLETHPDWKPDWPLIVLDGFDSFTKPQQKALGLLSERVPEILITLPGTKDMTRRVHLRFADTLKVLSDLDTVSQFNIELSSHLPPALAYLEENLGEIDVKSQSLQKNITLVETKSQADEAREALRWLKARILRDGVRPQMCAITIPDPGSYLPHLRAVADEFGLPLDFSVGQQLDETPLFAALETLLSLAVRDFPRRLVLDTIRSPYFNLMPYGLVPTDADILDLVSRTRQVIGGQKTWLESLDALKSQTVEEEQLEDDDQQAPQLPSGSKVEELQAALENFFNRISPPDQEQSLIEWITWLEKLLEELDFWQESEFEADTDAMGTLRQIFRDLVLVENVIGPELYTYQTFHNQLTENAKRTEVHSLDWSKKPAIRVLRTVEGRGLRHKAVAVLGLSEGIFPRPQKADPFLDEETRNAIGLESAFDQHQFGLFYQAVTRTDQYLLLTRPYLSPSGEAWEVSPYWEEVKRLNSDSPQIIETDANRPLSEAASSAEILAWATRQGTITPSVMEDLTERVERVLHGRQVLEHRLTEVHQNIYAGDLSDERNLLQNQSSVGTVWSASRLESYIACPYRFYTASLLNLEAQEEPDLGMDAAQLGSIYHRILERVFRETHDPTNLEDLLATLAAVAKEVFIQAPSDYGFRPTPQWLQEQAELQARLVSTIEALHAESDGWIPTEFEAAFGLWGREPLVIELESGKIQLRGLIDRVDQDAEGNFRIIDYKTGSSKLGNKDLEEGIRIQLPLYALAARDTLGMGEPADGFYWAINAAKSSSLSIKKYGFDDAVAVALEHVNAAVEGIHRGDFKPTVPKGGCPKYCPAADWCWAYEPQRSWG